MLNVIPKIFIIMAPPAVGFVSYVNLMNTIDPFANILYGVALFFGFILLMQLPKIFSQDFAVPFWAMLFPSGAMTIATIRMFQETQHTINFILNIIQMVGLLRCSLCI